MKHLEQFWGGSLRTLAPAVHLLLWRLLIWSEIGQKRSKACLERINDGPYY
jgi:hypothetical protein